VLRAVVFGCEPEDDHEHDKSDRSLLLFREHEHAEAIAQGHAA
jgi:hypothetical protein